MGIRTGPPIVAPQSLFLRNGLTSPPVPLLVYACPALSTLLTKYSYPLPWYWSVPEREVRLTSPPVTCPNSAAKLLL